MPRLEQIWLKRAKLGPMDPVAEATLVPGLGLHGNANQRGRRQVTIVSLERWRAIVSALNAAIHPSVRRANLLVSGIDLENTRGAVLRVGGYRLRINGETRPCERMEQAHPGLREAMVPHWGGGAYAEVLDGGVITIGDEVSLETED
jgi:MOSC domain-containing protein YiiM